MNTLLNGNAQAILPIAPIEGFTPDEIKRLHEPFEIWEYEFLEGFLYVQVQAAHQRAIEIDPNYQWIENTVQFAGKNGRILHAQGTMIIKGVARVGVGYDSVNYTKKQAAKNAKDYEARKKLLEEAIAAGVMVQDDQDDLEAELDKDDMTSNGLANQPGKSGITDAKKRGFTEFGIGLHIRETYKTVTNFVDLYDWLEARKRGDWTKAVFAKQCYKVFGMLPKQIGDALAELGYKADDGVPYVTKFNALTKSANVWAFARELQRRAAQGR